MVNPENGKVVSVPAEKIQSELNSILSSCKDCNLILSKFQTYLKPSNEESVSFDRVNNMVEFLQCYPIQVRKNKNESIKMDEVLHPKELPSKNTNTKVKITEDHRAQKLMMYVWSKMCD